MYKLSYHFREIRSRVLYISISLICTIITTYYYQFEILYIIGRPFLELDHKFVLIDLTEAFYTILRICGVMSFLIIIPFFIYHFWSFYIPSRYYFERKTINKFSMVFFFLLLIELLILYFIIFPKICEFLLSFKIISSDSCSTPIDDLQNKKQLEIYQINQERINSPFFFPKKSSAFFYSEKSSDIDLQNITENEVISYLQSQQELAFDLSKKSISGNTPVFLELTARLESYVDLSTSFYFIMLTLFQIPFVVIMLYYYKILDCYILCKFRKFFLFSSLLISAFISPPDIISQCILAILIFFFYELLVFLGIFYSKIIKI